MLMNYMEFDTILSDEEIANNISTLLKEQKTIFPNIITFLFGDISYDLKMEGYVKDNNFYLVSYSYNYIKSIEIKGQIRKFGEVNKITFNVNWVRKFDIIIIYLLCALVVSYFLNFKGVHPIIIISLFITTLPIIIKLIIFINKKIINNFERKIFKTIIDIAVD